MSVTAADVMTTELVTVTPTTPLQEFARVCVEDHISGAPVLEVDGRLVGIVSKTDLVERIIAEDPRWGSSLELPDELREVQDIMNPEVVTVAPETGIAELAERMAEQRVHRVVVLKNGKVLGMVTSLDLLRHFGEA